MGDDVRRLRATYLTCEAIPSQRGRLGLRRARPVIDVETYVECDAHQGRHGGTLAPAHKHHQRQGRRMVEGARCSMLRRVRLVIEAHSGDRVHAPVARQEPQVVVDVDEDARSPWHRDRSTETGIEKSGGPTGERNMVANAHWSVTRWP
jgi:hypothetical protein